MENSFFKGKVNPTKDAELLGDLHANVGWFTATGCAAGLGDKMTFNTSQFERIDGIGDADLLKQFVTETHKRGVKAIAYLNLHWYSVDFGAEHPDWEQRMADGRSIGQVRPLYGKGTSFCVNGPWRDWSYELIREAAGYDIDGVFLDGPVVYPGCCYCDSCRGKFGERFGGGLPEEENWSDPRWKQFVRFRQHSMEDYLRDARDALKAIKPEAIIYLNSGNWNSDWRAPRDIQYLADYQDITGVEAFFSRPLERQKFAYYTSASAKYVKSAGKPSTIFFTTWQSPSENFVNTPAEIKLLVAETVANGSNPWVIVLDETLESFPRALEPVRKMYTFLESREEFYTHTESGANVALWSSMQTKFFYCSGQEELYSDIGTGKEEDLQIDLGSGESKVNWKARKELSEQQALYSFQGFFDALTRAHIPFDLIVDRNITPEGLEKYDVLVMPDVACLSEEQAETIRAFVKNGGGLIADFESSLYDEEGALQDKFLLEDLFHAAPPEGMFSMSNFDSMVVKEKHDAAAYSNPGEYIPRPSQALKTRSLEDASVPVKVMEPLDFVITSVKGESIYPGLVVSSFGRGKVFYSPTALGCHYYENRMIPHKKLIENGVRWLLGDRSLIEVDGPGTVEVVLRTQKDKCRTLIHLINITGEMQRPIEQVIPVFDISVKVRTAKAKKVFTLVEKEDIPFQSDEKGWTSFTLPKLSLYEVVVVEISGQG
jgi:type 1 glutamine amidotransferase